MYSFPKEGSLSKPLPEEIKACSKVSLHRWLFKAGIDWFVISIACVFALSTRNLFYFYLTALIIGNRQHALAILGHEGAHWLISPNRVLNDFLASCICFWPLGASLSGYRNFHLAHHRYLGTDQDPERSALKKERDFKIPVTKTQLGVSLMLDLTGLNSYRLLRILGNSSPKSIWEKAKPLLFQLGIFAILFFYGNSKIILLWFCGLGIGFWFAFRMRTLTEHSGIKGTYRISFSPLLRLLFLPHHTWYHFEHHAWPSVPCHNLPKVRKLTWSDEKTLSQGEFFSLILKIPKNKNR